MGLDTTIRRYQTLPIAHSQRYDSPRSKRSSKPANAVTQTRAPHTSLTTARDDALMFLRLFRRRPLALVPVRPARRRRMRRRVRRMI